MTGPGWAKRELDRMALEVERPIRDFMGATLPAENQTVEALTAPGDVPAAPEGECNGCRWGWERYQNQSGIWLHRNAADTLGCLCTLARLDGAR